MVINDLKLNAKVEQLFNEIQLEEKNLQSKKKLHVKLISIQNRSRKIFDVEPDGTPKLDVDGNEIIIVESIPIMDDITEELMSDVRRQEIYDKTKLQNIGLDI